MCNFRILLPLLVLAAYFGQTSAFVRHNIPNLTSREISKIIQDSKGFIWIGTDNGLNRFDGWTNVPYTHSREDSTSLQNNMVEALFNDSDGNLWIGTGSGLQRYMPGSGSFRNVTFPGINALSVRSIIQIGKEKLLTVTSGFGAFSIDTKTMTAFPMDTLNKTIGTTYAHVIRMDPLNRIWIGAADGRLVSLDKNLNKLFSTKFHDKVIDIASYSNNDVYVATTSEIYVLDGSKRQFEKLNAPMGGSITGFLTDSEGKLMIHTRDDGVFRIESRSIHPEDTYAALKGEGILTMYEDRDGDIWIGTRKGGVGMLSNAPELFKFQDIATAPSVRMETLFDRSFGPGVAVAMSDGSITALDPELNTEAKFQSQGRVTSACRLHDGTILLGYEDGRIMRFKGHDVEIADQPGTKAITALGETPAGGLFAALSGEGFAYKTGSGNWKHIKESTDMATSARLGNDWINVIAPDNSGKVWLGHHNGIDLFDPTTNRFTESKSIQRLRAHIVNSILPAKDRTLWIGTNNGLYHLFPDEDRMDFYGIREGLTGNVICGIQQANNGDIWCTTNNGIAQIRYADGKVVNYITGNGLGDRDYSKGMLMRGSGDKLFAVGFNGITAFYPDAITDPHPVASPVLTRVYLNVNDEELPEISYNQEGSEISASVRLKYNQNTFSLDLSTFDYRNPGNVSFEYRIPSLDKEWRANPFGDNRVICNYMKPGKYILEVRAIENGQTSPTTSILIEILPPWYLTIWAKIIYAILLMLAAAAIWYAMRRYRQRRQNDEIAEEKFKMLYNFAHELRSPVTLITSPLTSLIHEETDERKANTFRMIQRNGYRITNLVNKMLDVRRIEKGQLKLSFSETDLKEYIELIVEDFRLQAESRKITLSFSAPDGPVKAYIDPDNFDKVIVNLISNALKFTPDGGAIDVTLKKSTGRDGKEQASVEVSDTGCGIPAQDLTHIFDRFYQGDIKSKGFGIGLNLSKMLVDLHHGSITASNRSEGSGATFEVLIPLGRAHLKDKEVSTRHETNLQKKYIEAEEAMAIPIEADDRKASRQHRVIIADDDEEIRQYLKRELGNTYKIVCAADGEEAYAIALDKQIDLIVSDIRMPKTDGFGLLKQIRSNADLAHIPIILLTTSEDFNTRMAGWEKGADGYLTKPFRIEELRQLCASLISGRIRLKGRFSHGEKIEETIDKIEIKGNDELLLERITKAVNENLGDSEFGVEQLAEAVGLSRVHLHRKMKALIGLAPRDFLKSVRLKRAAELLKQRNTNISQVGYSVGFSSPGQFSESFRKYYGCSPSEYIARDTEAVPGEDNPSENDT